jgi:hypothetical protein
MYLHGRHIRKDRSAPDAFPPTIDRTCIPGDRIYAVAECLEAGLLAAGSYHHPEKTNRLLARSPVLAKPPAAIGPILRNIVPILNRMFDMLQAQKLLVPKTMHAFLEGAGSYDIAIVVLPSFTPGADSLAVGSALDGVVLVAGWGRAARRHAEGIRAHDAREQGTDSRRVDDGRPDACRCPPFRGYVRQAASSTGGYSFSPQR